MKLFNALSATVAWADVFQGGEKHIKPELSNSVACGWWDIGNPLRINNDRILNPDRLIDPDRIINGKDVAHGSWPWIVGFTENGNRVCSGTIIHDRWIISAEHCFPQHLAPRNTFVMTAEEFPAIAWTKMYFGDHNKRVQEDSEFWVSPQKLVFRDNRSPTGNRRDTTAADIVMIQVESITAKLTNSNAGYVKPACLPSVAMDAEDPYAGQHCWIAGWGYTRFGETWWGGVGGSRLASILQEAGINIFSNQYCAEKSHMTLVDRQEDVTSSTQLQTYNEFCAGVADIDGDGQIDGETDACSGDSGGPLICDENGKPTLVGITSRGKGCAMVDNPGVYTPTWPFHSWIEHIVREMTDQAPRPVEPVVPVAPVDPVDPIVADPLAAGERSLMQLVEGCTLTATCIKGNGQPHPGKTTAQNKNRLKKIAQFKKAIKKYIGESKKSTKCAKPDATMPSLAAIGSTKSAVTIEDVIIEIVGEGNCFQVLEDAVEECMKVVYADCKPYPNWVRSTMKKVAALVAWADKAEKGGCSLA